MDRLQHNFKPLDGSLHDTSSQVSWKHSYKSYNKHAGLLENYLLDMIGHDSTRIWHEFWVFWPLSWQNIYISSHISVELVKNLSAETAATQYVSTALKTNLNSVWGSESAHGLLWISSDPYLYLSLCWTMFQEPKIKLI